MNWNAGKYLAFKNERTQPSIDLVHRISLQSPERIIDIGCGPGNSTEQLKIRYPNARVTGADNSESMINAARENHPDIEFVLLDASEELCRLAEKYDIVFSNACIQWIPDHPKLLREMSSILNDGGILAVQLPMIYDEPIHRILLETAEAEKWRGKLGGARHFYTLSPEEYYDILADISPDFSMWQTTYFHRMKSHRDIIEWYKSTGMRPYLEALQPGEAEEFEEEIFRRVTREYKVQAKGEIIFRFPRLFFTLIKS